MTLAAVEFGGKKVTVKDLIEALRACPENATVLMDASRDELDTVNSVEIGSTHTPIFSIFGLEIPYSPRFEAGDPVEGWEATILIR